MSHLTFDTLRLANTKRLPTFKNAKGEPAHSQPDGSDWSDAQWLGAVLGELGEFANLQKKVVRGDISMHDAKPALAKELADVVTYLDLLAYRMGIDLGWSVHEKFNEVSARVESPVTISPDGSRVIDPRPVMIYQFGDEEWWAGHSEAEVIAAIRAEYGDNFTADEYDDIELLSPPERDRLKYRDDDGSVRTFEEQLQRMIAASYPFPAYFAGQE